MKIFASIPRESGHWNSVGSHLFVLETDSGVRGTAFLTICLDAMYGFRPYGVVENMVVETSMRRAGGGRELMGAIEQVARAGTAPSSAGTA
jgi:GNAT superfamily N-acetyltransferase